MSFLVWDYVVFVGMLLISAGIGVYYRFTGGKQKTTNEYLLADRNMSIWPVSFSLMASFMSAVTLLGVSMENYQFGMIFIVINISYGIATPIAAYLYLPVFFKLQATSAYEYLEKRFGRLTRTCASLAYSLQMILYMGIVVYAPALALETTTGISKTGAILAIGLVCTFYSTIGGMKAVLITDVFQSILMFAAIFCVIISAAIKAGGIQPILDTAVEGGRINFWNFNPDPTERHTWFSLIIGGAFTYLSLYGVNQTQVQRLLTVKDLKASQKALWLNWPILTLLSLSTSFSGLAIYYFYSKCDPLLSNRISSRDQLMPIYVIDAISDIPGVTGLFVSGIFSASLSTVSAAVNSLAAVTMEDYFKPLYKMIKKHPLSDIESTVPLKIIACIYGLLCVGIAFIAQGMGGVLQASLTIFGVVGGPLFGLFTLGMFTTMGNQKGAITGLACGLAFSMWIGFGQPRPPVKMLQFSTEDCSSFSGVMLNMTSTLNSTSLPAKLTSEIIDDNSEYFWLYRVSYMWFCVLGFLVTLTIGYLSSFIYEKLNLQGESTIYLDNNKTFINTDLFSPPIAKRLKRKMVIFGNGNSINVNGEESYNTRKDTHL